MPRFSFGCYTRSTPDPVLTFRVGQGVVGERDLGGARLGPTEDREVGVERVYSLTIR